jgi:hypothetical protein
MIVWTIITAAGIMTIYSIWNNTQADKWAKREIDIFSEAMYRKEKDNRSILDHVHEIKKERGIKKDLIERLLMAEYKFKKRKG